jgi:serine/threonine protein kinase
MGEVYKAHDSRLDRTVAVKILPPHVAADTALTQRFEREAKVLAALSHPHICAVFDVGRGHTEQGDLDFLVMEYLEGETLAQRLARGALPLTDALRYGIQIADALDKAHRRGVVHRDLKPGNVMLTTGGVKLLDFGLAKLEPVPGHAVDVTRAPTVTSPLTGAGSIVGTFQYMAPEQVEGREADARTDIFAFGAVLYEMLTGTRAFEGKSQAGLIAAILEREPKSVSSLLPTTPPALDQLVKTCLEKHPENRWQSASDVGRQLKWILDGGSQQSAAAPVPVPHRPRRAWPLVAVAVALIALAGAGLAVWTLTRPAPATVSRLLLAQSTETPFVTVGGVDVLLSPDGQRIVYLGRRPGGFALYVRELRQLESRMIAGTELPENFNVANPFLSWDGSSVVFRSPGQGIFSVPLNGGTPLKLADDSPRFLGGAWGPDDTIIVSLADGLYRAKATGGTTLERLTPPGPPRVLFINPSMLPDGKGVLFHMTDLEQRTSRVAVFEIETREQKTLIEGGSEAKYLAPGYLVFARETTLMAAPFDARSRALTGPAVAVQPDVNHPALLSATDYSVSGNGNLIYVPSTAATQVGPGVPVWVDRSGRPAGPMVSGQVVAPWEIRLSPDGRRLVVSGGRPGDRDLWVYDLGGRPPIPLADKGDNVSPLWSPDGTRVVFASNRDGGRYGLYSLPADGGTSEPALVPIGVSPRASGIKTPWPEAWMPDGRLVFADDQAAAQSRDLLIASSGTSEPETLIKTEYSEDSSAVSPDGRWVAYRSNRTGRGEIWVRAIAGGAPVRVSQNGGAGHATAASSSTSRVTR